MIQATMVNLPGSSHGAWDHLAHKPAAMKPLEIMMIACVVAMKADNYIH